MTTSFLDILISNQTPTSQKYLRYDVVLLDLQHAILEATKELAEIDDSHNRGIGKLSSLAMERHNLQAQQEIVQDSFFRIFLVAKEKIINTKIDIINKKIDLAQTSINRYAVAKIAYDAAISACEKDLEKLATYKNYKPLSAVSSTVAQLCIEALREAEQNKLTSEKMAETYRGTLTLLREQLGDAGVECFKAPRKYIIDNLKLVRENRLVLNILQGNI